MEKGLGKRIRYFFLGAGLFWAMACGGAPTADPTLTRRNELMRQRIVSISNGSSRGWGDCESPVVSSYAQGNLQGVLVNGENYSGVQGRYNTETGEMQIFINGEPLADDKQVTICVGSDGEPSTQVGTFPPIGSELEP